VQLAAQRVLHLFGVREEKVKAKRKSGDFSGDDDHDDGY